jgi:hypothetical protein
MLQKAYMAHFEGMQALYGEIIQEADAGKHLQYICSQNPDV